jgi:hypothetical protein
MTRSRRRRQRVMRGLACLALLAGSAAAGVAWARIGTVTTITGERYDGDVVERGDEVVVTMKGNIPITRKRNEVQIEYAASTAEQFQQRLAKLDKKDSNGRVELARWAIDRREPDLALDALDEAIDVNPSNEDAIMLRTVVEKQRRIQQIPDAKAGRPTVTTAALAAPAAGAAPAPQSADRTGRRPAASPPPAAGTPSDNAAAGARRPEGTRPAAATKPKGPVKTRLVTPAEINHIRQLELQAKEQVQVRFINDVKHRYQQNSGIAPQEFNKMTPLEQAREILANGGTKMHADVLIKSDPASLAQFKRDVQRTILPGCATTACHGTVGKAGNFFLHNPAAKEAETYTNFMLLQDYPISTGDKSPEQARVTVDGRDYAMLDRQRPANSLLLLYGLPQKDSPLAHPDAQGYKSIFKGRNDPKYQAVYNWMHDTLAPVPPEYGIDLTKDVDESTTRPSRAAGGGGGSGGPPPARDAR